MKKIGLLILASLFLGFATTNYTAVTHTINNTSDHAIEAETYYRGRVDWLKSCRPDIKIIQPGQALISKAGGCLLEWVQVRDNTIGKTIKLTVANASANIAKEVGLGVLVGTTILSIGTFVGAGLALSAGAMGDAFAVATVGSGAVALPSIFTLHHLTSGPKDKPIISKVYELVVYAGTSTTWEYDGTSLKPTSGVRVYEIGDFTKSN